MLIIHTVMGSRSTIANIAIFSHNHPYLSSSDTLVDTLSIFTSTYINIAKLGIVLSLFV